MKFFCLEKKGITAAHLIYLVVSENYDCSKETNEIYNNKNLLIESLIWFLLITIIIFYNE